MQLDITLNGQWSFSYDKLDRLMTGTPSSGPYQGQYGCWGYDSFGNRTINVVNTAACTTTATATYNANNQITWLQTLGAPGYSPAGNVSSDSLNQYLYDNENRVCAVRNLLTYAMTGYLYDGGGERVAKGTVANLNACPAAQGFASITAQYLLGPDGEQVTELDGSGNWQHTNLFAAGRLLATYDTRGQHFHFTDWLGTRRAQATAAGVSEEQCQSLPFGDGLSCSGSGVDATEHHFTGKERDTESGNDYFGARYYSSTVGRFMTPDWSLKAEPVPFARLDIPQTLNLYAYVGNNPLTHTDVDGHAGEPPDLNDPACNPTGGGKCPNQVAAAKLEAKAKDDARQAQLQNGADTHEAGHTGGQQQGLHNQQLKYKTVSGGQGTNPWQTEWGLTHTTKLGGWIIQHIVADFIGSTQCNNSGHCEYWEAFPVPANSRKTSILAAYGYDDQFASFTADGRPVAGSHIHASARFYENLTLPDSFTVQPRGFPAGDLRATTTNPNLSTENATAPNVRWWMSY